MQRLGSDAPAVNGGLVAIVAAIGVVLNAGSALMFAKGREKDINIRGAFLHLVADAAVSAGVYPGVTGSEPRLSVVPIT